MASRRSHDEQEELAAKWQKQEENQDPVTAAEMQLDRIVWFTVPKPRGTNVQGERRVYVHEKLLRSSFPYFDEQLESRLLNEICQEMALKWTHSAVYLESCVHWSYSQKLPTTITETQDPEYLAGAYSESHMLGNDDFTDAVMDQLIRCVQADSIKVGRADPSIYEHHLEFDMPLTDSWAFKNLLVDLAVHWCRPPYSGFDPSDLGYSFQEETLKAMMKELLRLERGEPATNPFTADRCTYHEHTAKGLPCYKTKS